MDKYNCKWPLWFKRPGADDNAVTIGQTTYYSRPKEYVEADPEWMAHENEHKKQWARDGRIKFALKYIWYSITVGYDKNPYELEAEAVGRAAKNPTGGA